MTTDDEVSDDAETTTFDLNMPIDVAELAEWCGDGCSSVSPSTAFRGWSAARSLQAGLRAYLLSAYGDSYRAEMAAAERETLAARVAALEAELAKLRS
jgi:hypothetical protein